MKFYFLGEFGYVFRQLLPFLEKCTFEIELITWDPVCKIIEILWPKRYKLISIENFVNYELNEKYRDCTHFRHIPTIKLLEKNGYKHFFSIDPNHRIFHDDAHKVFGVLNKKLVYGEQFNNKPYISVFPRKRTIQNIKNCNMNNFITKITEKYPLKKIIGHGLKNERFDLNIIFVENIENQINVLNNSEFLITPASGMADFALICGCNVILTGDYINLDKTNPHGCYIKKWENL